MTSPSSFVSGHDLAVAWGQKTADAVYQYMDAMGHKPVADTPYARGRARFYPAHMVSLREDFLAWRGHLRSMRSKKAAQSARERREAARVQSGVLELINDRPSFDDHLVRIEQKVDRLLALWAVS